MLYKSMNDVATETLIARTQIRRQLPSAEGKPDRYRTVIKDNKGIVDSEMSRHEK